MRADLKNIVAAPHFHGIQKEMWVVKYLYSIVVLFIARRASPGSCRPEEKPSLSRCLAEIRVNRVDEMGTSPYCLSEGRRSRKEVTMIVESGESDAEL